LDAAPEANPWPALLLFERCEVIAVPKMKTHKASKKRFRVTASGKLKRRQAGKKHLLSHKTGARKRHLRAEVIENDKNTKMAKRYVKLMGGDA
jgi:large subunit ribosomal protein L35